MLSANGNDKYAAKQDSSEREALFNLSSSFNKLNEDGEICLNT